MNVQRVGSFIRARREAAGLTQRELADSLHITDSAVSKWERGLSLPDTAILTPLANALRVSEGELLQGAEKRTLRSWWQSIWAFSPPKDLLLRGAAVWLAALLLMEPVDLYLTRLYYAQGNALPMITTLSPYNVAVLAGYAIPSITLGLRLSKRTHERRPFPIVGRNPAAVWLRHCLPGLAVAFALWFFVFVFCAWQLVGFGWWAGELADLMGAWEQVGPTSRTIPWSWRNLPYFILTSILYGEYCFRALVFYLFYGLGVARYLARREAAPPQAE